jgi:hypothetical protein
LLDERRRASGRSGLHFENTSDRVQGWLLELLGYFHYSHRLMRMVITGHG